MSHLDLRRETTLCLLKSSKDSKQNGGGIFLTYPMTADLMGLVICDSLPHKVDVKYIRKMPVLCVQIVVFVYIQTRMLSVLKCIIEDRVEYLVYLCLVILVNYF